jgi:rfaE bifunctional protein kinase chain/domain
MIDDKLFNLISESELQACKQKVNAFIEKGAKNELEAKKFLVVGDIGLDQYIYTDVSRISPEAPVPVALVNRREEKLGLSANVAKNLTSLSSKCDLFSVIGSDEASEKIKDLAKKDKNLHTIFIHSKTRPTTLKTRVLSGQHHLLRIDEEEQKSLSSVEWISVSENIKDLDWSSYSAVILQDYGKGFLTEELCSLIISKAKADNVSVFVDPSSKAPLKKYKGADYFKPNQKEVMAYATADGSSYKKLLSSIVQEGQFLHVINTMGAKGMCLYSKGLELRVPTFAKNVFDVTGAGDTVVASLSLALSHGLSLKEAAIFSNICAGFVVAKVGAVTLKFEDIHKREQS